MTRKESAVKNKIGTWFEIEKNPRRGLLPVEWVVMGYVVLTLLLLFFTFTKVHNPESMLWGRMRVVAMTAAMWAVYRMVPCRLTLLARITAQMALLSWWYPDTYEFNRMFPNLDHLFAGYEQALFGCQPALTFAAAWSAPLFSELMHLAYASYFPLIVVVTLFYFFCRYERYEQATFIIMAAFFAYYAIFIFLPVTGPQYYYLAVGTEQIAQGVFPNVGDYFANHQEALPLPGWSQGVGYRLVTMAHVAGERPTAAFPSSHIGITTILLLLAWQSGSRRLAAFVLPFLLLMCFATVYVQAHYAIDVIGGLITGAVFYAMLLFLSQFMVKKGKKH